MALIFQKPLISQELIKISCLTHVAGDLKNEAIGVTPATHPEADCLVFIATEADFLRALSRGASVLIAEKQVAKLHVGPKPTIFSTDQISQAMAEVLILFDTKKARLPDGIAPSAKIHATARLGKHVKVGEFAVVDERVVIGDHSVISHHTVLERGAQVGNDCYLHPHVVIGSSCILGNRVEVHSHSTIGSDGFGFVTQKDLTHRKIPQLGVVRLEDDVEIGAQCAIDRATLTETKICRGTKLDNFIHIAHNCSIGANSRLTAGFIIAGSSRIGENFLTGGATSVTDHVSIADNVVLAGRSAVTKDIDQAGAYGGYPLEPLKDALRTLANFTKITSLRREVAEIRRHLGLKKSEEEK